MKFKIGDTLLDNNVFLAPMAGVTDLPFRLLCREQGAGMSVTEMVSAKAILYKNKKHKRTSGSGSGRRSCFCTAVWLRSGDHGSDRSPDRGRALCCH